jgi:YVTN family beta-propeller protein
MVLDAGAGNEIKRLKLGRNPEGIVVTPDGSRAYVAVSGDNSVAVIDLKPVETVGRISTGAGPDGMAWVEAK